MHLEHEGRDDEVWQDAERPVEIIRVMKAAAANPQDSMSRPLGGHFAIDRVEELVSGDLLSGGRLDAQGIGMAGRSCGVYTTLVVAGHVFSLPLGREATLSDSLEHAREYRQQRETRGRPTLPKKPPILGTACRRRKMVVPSRWRPVKIG